MKYLVVDGYALAHRAWHAYPDMRNDKGEETRVIVGFFKQLISKAGDTLLNHQLIFTFDAAGPTFRKEMDSDYKAGRTKNPQTFYNQIDKIVNLCKLIAPVYQVPGFEADDLAGSFVEQFVGPDDEAVLLTVDGDWLQLLRKNVTVMQLKTVGSTVHWTRELFFEKYSGITPTQLIDLKALMGDESDNIPKIKGCGWVMVNSLLKRYQSVEGIYENILKIPNKGGVQVNLMENKARVFLNKTLATIRKDVPLDKPELVEDKSEKFIDFLIQDLNADSLANLMGVYFQSRKGGG